MKCLLEAIKKHAVATFSKTSISCEVFEENISKIHKLMNKLTANDVALDHDLLRKSVQDPQTKLPSGAPMTYVDILDHQDFTINMFILRTGSYIPLHDHPCMYGILKVVYGTVNVKSYTLIENQSAEIESHGLLAVEEEKVLTLDSNNDAILLTPVNRNFHEIRTVDGPAAFVDILAPPYYTMLDGEPRKCNYYVEKQDENGRKYLKPSNMNHDCWMDSAPFLGSPL